MVEKSGKYQEVQTKASDNTIIYLQITTIKILQPSFPFQVFFRYMFFPSKNRTVVLSLYIDFLRLMFFGHQRLLKREF